ncbi:hypothetical protein J7I42_34825 [Niastella sp. MAH-29]|uniref:Uncharacterized protein n=2 Tax=Chitinophagaceae TaxID=563835 RepID=A0ABS3Z5U9_9BACT|nr:hypothetical protein [Niastella soli]
MRIWKEKVLKSYFQKLQSNRFYRKFYPEIKKAGGLPNALNLEFEKINSTCRAAIDDSSGRLPVIYARVQSDNKFSQIYIAAEKKLYLSDFWRDGVCLAQANIGNITDLAKTIDYWLKENVSTQEFSLKYPFVEPNEKAKAFDNHNEVEYAWNCLLGDGKSPLAEFIQLASNDEILGKLFPFTSLYTLCFSRCTGFPFDSEELPNITPIAYIHWVLPKDTVEYASVKHYADTHGKAKIFVVTKNKNQYLGEGTAREALSIARNNLAANTGPAIKGIKAEINRQL